MIERYTFPETGPIPDVPYKIAPNREKYPKERDLFMQQVGRESERQATHEVINAVPNWVSDCIRNNERHDDVYRELSLRFPDLPSRLRYVDSTKLAGLRDSDVGKFVGTRCLSQLSRARAQNKTPLKCPQRRPKKFK